jgi:hypothetical protein
MAELSQVVEDIRSLVAEGDLKNSDFMQRLAGDFAEISRPVVDRLRRCDEMLQKGLRSEALHLARTEPELLDLVNQLEFPGREQWDKAVLKYGLARSPRPSAESAAALNRAYAEEEPLRPLLIKHRLLALSRAGYLERMNVLREMLKIDPGNIAFQEDLAQFEGWRVQYLESEISAAKNSNNTTKIVELVREVEQTTWINPPPQRITQAVRAIGSRLRRETLEKTAKVLAAQMSATYQRKDEGSFRTYLEEFKTITSELGWNLVDNPVIRLQPMLDWLEKQNSKRTSEFEMEVALGDMESTLANPGATEQELAAVMERASGIGKIPQALEERWSEAYDQRYSARKRKEYILLGAALTIGAIAMIAFLYLVMRRR